MDHLKDRDTLIEQSAQISAKIASDMSSPGLVYLFTCLATGDLTSSLAL